ncbi:MAG: hypothetical protein NT004_05800 [Bacteroidetes bacterium]|nr:hypothetical protein [Bacteroidota bacterium]
MKTRIAITLLFLGTMVYAFSQNCVSIATPLNGNSVSQMGNTIKFNICRNLQTNRVPVVFICDPTGQWWPYINSIKIPSQNKWELKNVQFGVPSDAGSSFKIQVVAIEDKLIETGFTFGSQTIFVGNSIPLSQPVFAQIKKMYPNDASPIIKVISQ